MSDVEHAGRSDGMSAYLALTALLIDREIAKFRRGEQAAIVSFIKIARLARNAREELIASGIPAPMQRDASVAPAREDSAFKLSEEVGSHGPVREF